MLRMRCFLMFFIGVASDLPVSLADPCLEWNHTHLFNIGARNEHCLAENIPTSDRLCDNYLPTEWYITKDALMLNKPPTNGSCGVNIPLWLAGRFPEVSDGISDKNVCVKVGNNNCHEVIKIQIKNCSSFYVYKLQQLPDHIGCPAAYCFVSALPCIIPSTTTQSTIPTTKETPTVPDANNVASGKDSQQTITLTVSLTVSVCAVAVMAILVARLAALKHKGSESTCRGKRVGQERSTIQNLAPPTLDER